VVPAGTFCGIHVIEHIPGEQRFIAAYYTQGIKIVDYYVNAKGQLQFVERSSFTLPNANTWTAESFKVRRHADGTRTYFIAVNDIHRGIDVISWRGAPNPVGSKPPKSSDLVTNSGLLGASALVLAGAALYRRRHRAAG
jgi:MYXO-CTERM domain-containing protein